jgi:hypothetical protein
MTPQESDLPSELAAPAQRALVGAGYLRLEQLTKVSETELNTTVTFVYENSGGTAS